MTSQTLTQAIFVARKPGTCLHRAINGLVGCPIGGWGETDQARRRVVDELPRRSERDWTASQLIEAVLDEDYAGRYAWREDVRS